jgi:3-hydroxyacyl-[acyl-carrier-protein] dehydratase
MNINVEDYIPQRAPFKFVDTVIEQLDNNIIAEVTMKESFDFYGGHFPGNAVTPGVILCESLFQTGALLMGLRGSETSNNTAVVTRIQNAKFKTISRPGDIISLEVEIKEEIANAVYFKGKAKSERGTHLVLEFACALVDAQ